MEAFKIIWPRGYQSLYLWAYLKDTAQAKAVSPNRKGCPLWAEYQIAEGEEGPMSEFMVWEICPGDKLLLETHVYNVLFLNSFHTHSQNPFEKYRSVQLLPLR